MDASTEKTIERVILQMEENLGEELTVDDMARAACFSKFHFSRMFQRVTGISPGRFLSALRLERAKQLLLSTPLNVVDISHRVGYTSVGTFSSRFSSCVGVSPTRYRRMGGFRPGEVTEQAQAEEEEVGPSVTLNGRVLAPPDVRLGSVFVGLFSEPLPQGQPVRCAVVAKPGPYRLPEVPSGTWYLMVYATSLAEDEPGRCGGAQQRVAYVGSLGPMWIPPDGTEFGPVDLSLRPKRRLDPPVLIALPDLHNSAHGKQRNRGMEAA